MNSRRILLTAIFIFLASGINTGLYAQGCCEGQSESVLRERLKSANKLIPEAEDLKFQTHLMLAKGNLIAQNVTEQKVGYQSLLSQYNEALAVYRKHRQEYLEHVQRFHRSQSGPKVSSPYIPLGRLGRLQPLKLEVSDKCQQLVGLEAELMDNEKKVMEMFENLVSSRNKESDAEFLNMWENVYQQAKQNHDLALQYSQIGMAKTQESSSKIHDAITTATRDGILAYQQKVYGQYQRNNSLESAIYKRSNMHVKYSLMLLARLMQMRPSMSPSGDFVGGDQLEAESSALSREYSQVQELYRKLELAQKGK